MWVLEGDLGARMAPVFLDTYLGWRNLSTSELHTLASDPQEFYISFQEFSGIVRNELPSWNAKRISTWSQTTTFDFSQAKSHGLLANDKEAG